MTRRRRLLRWSLAMLGAAAAAIAAFLLVTVPSSDGQAGLAGVIVAMQVFAIGAVVTSWWLSGWRSLGWALVAGLMVVLAVTPYGLLVAMLAPFWWTAALLVAWRVPQGTGDGVA
jgi:hypothetical protein